MFIEHLQNRSYSYTGLGLRKLQSFYYYYYFLTQSLLIKKYFFFGCEASVY